MRPLWSDTVGPPTLLGMSADNREPSRPDLDAAPDEGSAPPAQPPEAAPQHRPTGWIVLSCVLALAVVGLAVWAFSAKSGADDAEAALKAQARAEATPTPTPTAAPPAGRGRRGNAAGVRAGPGRSGRHDGVRR